MPQQRYKCAFSYDSTDAVMTFSHSSRVTSFMAVCKPSVRVNNHTPAVTRPGVQTLNPAKYCRTIPSYDPEKKFLLHSNELDENECHKNDYNGCSADTNSWLMKKEETAFRCSAELVISTQQGRYSPRSI